MRRLLVVGILVVAGPSAAAQAEDGWPRFRGPNADGVSADHAGLPTRWTTTENVKWVADVPGWGWSCPIVSGNRVFLTSVVGDEKNVTPSKGLYQGEGVRDPANARQPGIGSAPLNTAALFGQTGVARLLLEEGADVSPASSDGNTALHFAAFFANVEVVEILLDKDAPAGVRNGRGETPLDVVSADWTPQLEATYASVNGLLGIELELAAIQQARPKIAKRLRERAAVAQEGKPAEGFPAVLQRDVTLLSDGTRLSGVLLYPKDRKEGEKLPALVLCSGWGGTKAAIEGSVP